MFHQRYSSGFPHFPKQEILRHQFKGLIALVTENEVTHIFLPVFRSENQYLGLLFSVENVFDLFPNSPILAKRKKNYQS